MGAYAEYLTMPERGIVALTPPGLSDREAASVPYGAVMAHGLLRGLHLQRGDRVLVVGASGGIGPMIVQLAARQIGATVTGVCSTARIDFVRDQGASAVVDYTRVDFTTRPEVYDVIIDVLGTVSFEAGRRVLAPHGRLVYLSFEARQLWQMLATRVVGGPRVICALVNEDRQDLETVAALIAQGVVRPVVDRVFPLAQAAEAHRYAESGSRQGAVVIAVGAGVA